MKFCLLVLSLLTVHLNTAKAVLMSETSVEAVAKKIENNARIGVFIGSFDPLHISHQKMIEQALNDKLVDFMIVGANDNMTHKPNASSWEARNSFLTAVYAEHEKVLIADDPSFGFPITGNTVGKIREHLKGTKVFTLIGNDIATLPHLYEDVPKMTFENGGQIDQWLVNESRPELNRSQQVPAQIANIPVLVFNSGSSYSSSTVRKDESLMKDPDVLDPRVYSQAKSFKLYGLGSLSCAGFL